MDQLYTQLIVSVATTLLLLCSIHSLAAQAPAQAQITWEVANRFRLFAEENDFDRQVNAWHSSHNGDSGSILDTERTLENQSKNLGWA